MGTPLALGIRSPSHLDSLEWLESEDQDQQLSDDDVVVQVQAIGLTFRDYLIAKEQLNETDIGTECAGIVENAGNKSGFQKGDRVCLLSIASARSVIKTKASAIVAIPPYMSFAEAASLPSVLWLAYHALFSSANLQKGETVLIHQGASCVGQMAIQLAQSLEARVLTTTSSTSMGTFIHDVFHVQETDIFDTDDGALISKIYQPTQG
ncbi:chaperonin 10-like protein [Hypoxylon crocopeplum]|nr:chaperonin 10-like protein [Hypoxylon crocopeplum]